MTSFSFHNGCMFTLDTLEAIKKVEKIVSGTYKEGLRLRIGGSSISAWEKVQENPGPTGMPPYASMVGTGREVYVSLESPDLDPHQFLGILWSIMVPMGFVPWDRYPVPSSTSHVFHFFGKWSNVGDSLQGEGKGEHSWPSMCVASQLEVGTWEGNRPTERSIQAHLHRLYIPCGPVDGIIGDRTISALRSLGMSGMDSYDIEQSLRTTETTSDLKTGEKRFGQLFMEGADMRVFSSGSVSSRKTNRGFVLTSWGPGIFNVVLD